MKIDVIIPSRGRPLHLMSVITCFDALSSGEHEITYNVVCDMDDPLTIKTVNGLPFRIAQHIGSGNLSKRMNEAAMQGDSQIVTTAADDVFPLAYLWDKILCAGMDEGYPAFSWQEVMDIHNHTLLVFSRKWLTSIGRMVPEYFPFWFGDTWVAEVYELAFGQQMPIIGNLKWGGKRGKTKGMRDVRFWFEFFAKTRSEREAEARSICFALDKPYVRNDIILADMARRDEYQYGRSPQYEEWFGANQGEPTQQYNDMKRIAEEWHG